MKVKIKKEDPKDETIGIESLVASHQGCVGGKVNISFGHVKKTSPLWSEKKIIFECERCRKKEYIKLSEKNKEALLRIAFVGGSITISGVEISV